MCTPPVCAHAAARGLLWGGGGGVRSLLPETLVVSTEVPTPWGDVMFAVSSVTLLFTWVLFLVS